MSDFSYYGENGLPNVDQEGTPNVDMGGVQQEFPESAPPSLRPGFKSVCARIGVMMIAVFGVRYLMNFIFGLLYAYLQENFEMTEFHDALISFAAAFVFLNVIPIAIGMAVLKFPFKERFKSLYAKPKYAGRAIGMFPAMYGAAMLMQILTLVLAAVFSGTRAADSFNATQGLLSDDFPAAVVRFIQAVIFAPILEELWFRGLVLESLRPYGNGFAIFVSAILFGVTHANLAQFFYATAIGLFLAYIAIHTGSLVVPMILHAMMNGIASITSLLITDPDVNDYLNQVGITDELQPVPSTSVKIYLVWNVMILLLMVVGIIMFIVKLVKIKRYKVPKMQTELSAGTRWGIFVSRPTVIISLLMAVDTMILGYITEQIVELLKIILYG